MSPDIAYVTTYPCPRCGAMLEAAVDEWQDWLRCPSCGKASRPPYERRARAEAVDDVLYIGTFATGPASTVPVNGSAAAPPWARPTPGMMPFEISRVVGDA